MHYVGIRELKNRLTYYLNLTRSGDNVIVTDRGKPLAILHSLDTVEADAGVEERLASLARKGGLRPPAPEAKFTRAAPCKAKGTPVSRLIVAERR